MSEELSLWALFFMMFLGVIWLTIIHKLQSIEKLLRNGFRPKNKKDNRPNDIRSDFNPKDRNI